MEKKKPTEFTTKVIRAIQKIPKGKVATYGQIAGIAGKPGGARAVVWILHSMWDTHKLPWHRVVSTQGIAFRKGSVNFREQKNCLKAEKVEISTDGKISFEKYQWKKKGIARKGRPRMFSQS